MRTLFLSVADMTVRASVVILAVLLVRLLLCRAPRKYAYWLWSVVAFRLCCPVSFQAVFSLFSLRSEQIAAVSTPAIDLPTAVPASPVAAPTSSLPVTASAFTPTAAADLPSVSVQLPTASAGAEISWLTVAAAIWLIGAAVLVCLGAVGYVRISRRLRTAILLSDRVYESDRVRSPFILGIVRPRIYLPFRLNSDTRRCALAHEYCHLRRRDHLVKAFAFLLLALHWFNPLCWAAFSLMGRDMEASCDEAVLAAGDTDRKTYSRALLAIAAERRITQPGSLAFGESDAERRIRRVLRWQRPRAWCRVLAAALALLAIAACAADPVESSDPPTTSAPPAPTNTEAPPPIGDYPGVLEYAREQIAQIESVEFLHLLGTQETAAVVDTKITGAVKLAELDGLADGVLELWTVQPLMLLDVNPYTIRAESGLKEIDGWHEPPHHRPAPARRNLPHPLRHFVRPRRISGVLSEL